MATAQELLAKACAEDDEAAALQILQSGKAGDFMVLSAGPLKPWTNTSRIVLQWQAKQHPLQLVQQATLHTLTGILGLSHAKRVARYVCSP